MANFEPNPSPRGLTILKIFNYAGAALIFFGIAYFISVNWYSLNDFLKIFATLGSAIAAFIIGILLYIDRKHEEAGSAFFMIAGLLLPVGIFVTLNVLSVTWPAEETDLFVTTICLSFFLLAFIYWPRTILLLFCIIFAALFFLSMIDLLITTGGIYPDNLFNYELMIVGLSCILLGRYLDLQKTYPLTGILYFTGALLLLTTSYFLSGSIFFGENKQDWRELTALFIILAFIFSVPLRSKAFLYLGAIFLVIYVFDMSYQFARVFGNMGWPLVLIIAGLLLMFLGYLIYYVHRKIAGKQIQDR